MIKHQDGSGEAAKVTRFRKCFDVYKLVRLADRFIAGKMERDCTDNFWAFGPSN